MPVVGRYEKLAPFFNMDLAKRQSKCFEVLERGYFIRESSGETMFPRDENAPPYVMPKGFLERVKEIESVFSPDRFNERRLSYYEGRNLLERVVVIEFSALTKIEMFYLAVNVANIYR